MLAPLLAAPICAFFIIFFFFSRTLKRRLSICSKDSVIICNRSRLLDVTLYISTYLVIKVSESLLAVHRYHFARF